MVMVWLGGWQGEVRGTCAPPPKSFHLDPRPPTAPPDRPPPAPHHPSLNPPLQSPPPPLQGFSPRGGGESHTKTRRHPPVDEAWPMGIH